MKFQDALVAWTPGTDQIRVGPLLWPGDPDWTERPIRYRCTGVAAYRAIREYENKLLRDMMLFIEFNKIVVRDQVPVAAAHAAFMAIDEYRERISPDIPGAEGRADDAAGFWFSL
jgi:hypothetical protein